MEAVIENLSGDWRISDYLGSLKSRLGIRRNRYKMEPGLYSIGKPDGDSPVIVTANYKMSVDHLRRAVKTLSAWIMVLDTKGINVWCAAGKGTFGTDELINRINTTGLSDIVSHRRLVLPQLGAPGIIPAEVKRETGFNVKYGPVEAGDLPEYIENGYKASERMRRKRFPLNERLAVSLTHFSQGLLPSLAIGIFLFLMDLVFFYTTGMNILESLVINTLIAVGALFSGSLLAGALLPILPGRAFSLKGLSLGAVFGFFIYLILAGVFPAQSILYISGKILLLLIWIVFQVLNLTGSSTYTSLSGVQKEMAISIPLMIIGAVAGLAMIITGGLLL